jgi:hypothetical protein
MIFAVDASTFDRCDAECSPERGFYYSASEHSVASSGPCLRRSKAVIPVGRPAQTAACYRDAISFGFEAPSAVARPARDRTPSLR